MRQQAYAAHRPTHWLHLTGPALLAALTLPLPSSPGLGGVVAASAEAGASCPPTERGGGHDLARRGRAGGRTALCHLPPFTPAYTLTPRNPPPLPPASRWPSCSSSRGSRRAPRRRRRSCASSRPSSTSRGPRSSSSPQTRPTPPPRPRPENAALPRPRPPPPAASDCTTPDAGGGQRRGLVKESTLDKVFLA